MELVEMLSMSGECKKKYDESDIEHEYLHDNNMSRYWMSGDRSVAAGGGTVSDDEGMSVFCFHSLPAVCMYQTYLSVCLSVCLFIQCLLVC